MATEEPAIALLDETWRSLDQLCSDLTPDQWTRPTDCPGWSVQDNLAHIVGLELLLEGEPEPPAPYPPDGVPEHVKNDLGASNEAWVASMRPLSGAEVLDKFRAVAGQRLASLRALDEATWSEPWPTPAGVQPYRDFMGLRSFDAWSHEQDIRRALDRPGHWHGVGADNAVGRLVGVFPFVVGKRLGAPDGTVVSLRLTDQVERQVTVAVTGSRAQVVTGETGPPTASLELPAEAFACLVLGRWDPELTLEHGDVHPAGNTDLARRLVSSLAVVS